MAKQLSMVVPPASQGGLPRGKLVLKGEPRTGLPNRSEYVMTHSKHANFLMSFADGVAAAAPSAARNAIARAKAAGLDISYVENGNLVIEAATGSVRSRTPVLPHSPKHAKKTA